MADEFPSEVDVVVVGTGLPESIASAALSRAGLSVLHLDRNDYYGSQWATFTLQQFLDFINQEKHDDDRSTELPSKEVDNRLDVPASGGRVWNVQVHNYMPENVEDSRQSSKSSPAEENATVCDKGDALPDYATSELPPQAELSPSEESSAHNLESACKSQKEDPDLGSASHVETDVDSKEDLNEPTCKAREVTPSDIDNTVAEIESSQGPSKQNANDEETSTPAPVKSSRSVASIESQARLLSGSADITMEDLLSQSRKFNIDLSPKLLYCRGDLVESLIEANISHYADFRVLDRILTAKDGLLVDFPCSKGDVFKSNLFSVIEKRILMKFLTFCQQYENDLEDINSFEGSTFIDFMKSKRLTSNLIAFVLTSIAMVSETCTIMDGLERTKKFLVSIGRYGNSPFLWPMYGIGELPQAFCRMSAVFAGTFCLRKTVQSLQLDDGICTSVIIDADLEIKTKHVVMEDSYIPTCALPASPVINISRCILLTVGSVKPSDEEHMTLAVLPTIGCSGNPVTLIEVGASSAGAPKGVFVTHLTVVGEGTPEEILKPYVNKYFTTEVPQDDTPVKPRVLWCTYFNRQGEYLDNSAAAKLPRNIFTTGVPDSSIGFEKAVHEAKKIFDAICPDGNFLEAVPNPENIIWDAPLTAPESGGSGYEGDTSVVENSEDSQEHKSSTLTESKSETLESSASKKEGSDAPESDGAEIIGADHVAPEKEEQAISE